MEKNGKFSHRTSSQYLKKARRERDLGLDEKCADWDSHAQTKNLTPHLGSCSLP